MKYLWLTLITMLCAITNAQAAFTGPDFSGIYDCTGQDKTEGAYKGKVTIHLVPEQSTGEYGAYQFLLEIPEYGAYPGHAAAQGKKMAIYFANTKQKDKDFGTGIASFSKNKAGKWTFVKFYYEPEYKKGNSGKEFCTQQ